MKKTYLSVVIGFFIVATIHVILSRGLFFDEGIYLIAGKTLVFRAENWNFQTWFVGSPWGFPRLAGHVLKLTSLFGWSPTNWTNLSVYFVREMNVLFGVLTTLVVFRISYLFNSRKHFIWPGLLFAFSGCVLFTTGFATYDALSLLFTSLAVCLILEAGKIEEDNLQKKMIFVFAGCFLGIAFVIKYITFVFVPALLAIVVGQLFHKNDFRSNLPKYILGLMLFLAGFLLIAATYFMYNFEALKMVFGFSGGHNARYGATVWAIVAEIVFYVGLLFAMATMGMTSKTEDGTWWVRFAFFGSAFIVPVYHMVFVDPLALFKQMMWVSFFLSFPAGFWLRNLFEKSKKTAAIVFTLYVLLGMYQVFTLERFYPDPTPASNWLQDRVTVDDCNILVDDVWAYRWALNTVFDRQEWCVTDQWWWYGQLATPEMWVEYINNNYFSYVVLERGAAAFNGNYTIFNDDVIMALENSGNYEKVAEFESNVTWGNAIIMPGFNGLLEPNSVVTTEIWKRSLK